MYSQLNRQQTNNKKPETSKVSCSTCVWPLQMSALKLTHDLFRKIRMLRASLPKNPPEETRECV